MRAALCAPLSYLRHLWPFRCSWCDAALPHPGSDAGFPGAEIGCGRQLSACLGTRLGGRTRG